MAGGKISPGRRADPRWVRLAIVCLEVFLVLGLAYGAARLAIGPEEKSNQSAVFSRAAIPAVTQADYTILTSFDAFNRSVLSAVRQQPEELPESSLKIEVFGLRAHGDGAGSAIIKLAGDDQRLVNVGEKLSAAVELKAVYEDRLEIIRSGRHEAVYLRPKAERSQLKQAVPVPGPKKVSSGLLQDIAALKVEVVKDQKQIIGFRITGAQTPATLESLGLEENDVLTAVNGSPLTSYERLYELPEEFSGVSEVQIEFERRGAHLTKTVKIQ